LTLNFHLITDPRVQDSVAGGMGNATVEGTLSYKAPTIAAHMPPSIVQGSIGGEAIDMGIKQ